jgi:hypothetical protein
MADGINKEFADYREMFETEEEKQAFDKHVKLLLVQHGVDYVRGYVDALRDIMRRSGPSH